jgi:hypothetical protein
MSNFIISLCTLKQNSLSLFFRIYQWKGPRKQGGTEIKWGMSASGLNWWFECTGWWHRYHKRKQRYLIGARKEGRKEGKLSVGSRTHTRKGSRRPWEACRCLGQNEECGCLCRCYIAHTHWMLALTLRGLPLPWTEWRVRLSLSMHYHAHALNVRVDLERSAVVLDRMKSETWYTRTCTEFLCWPWNDTRAVAVSW